MPDGIDTQQSASPGAPRAPLSNPTGKVLSSACGSLAAVRYMLTSARYGRDPFHISLSNPAHQHGVAKQEQHDFGDCDGPEREEVWETYGKVEHRGDACGDYESEDETGDVGAYHAAYPPRHQPAERPAN